MATDTEVLYVANDNLLKVNGLYDNFTEQYLNAATVTATLKDSADNNVAGQVWPMTLSYVAASNGNYRGVFENALSILESGDYTAHVDVDAGAGRIAHFELPLYAARRTS